MKLGIFKKDGFFYQLAKIIFRISLIIFLILFVIETILPGFVISWFNPVGMLIIAVVSGIILL